MACPGFHSEFPSGLPDTQTAASWGPETPRHLPRGQAIIFPETGHGALGFLRWLMTKWLWVGKPGVPKCLAPGQNCPILRCMTGSAFIHRVQRYAKAHGLVCRVDHKRGKGSHPLPGDDP